MDSKQLPVRPNLEQYKKQAKDLVKSLKTGNPEAIERIRNHHPRAHNLRRKVREGALTREQPANRLDAEFRRSPFTLADAQLVIAHEYGFESWPKFKQHLEELTRKSSAVSNFESAVDAIITGDVATLERLLRENPELIRARSTRAHHSTLLHYVSANGVEDFRQKTPKNAVEVAKLLLKFGAEVDSTADSYGGGSTTLDLTASSVHPLRAGVQSALIETLLDAGAAIGGISGGWPPLMSALANYRQEAAESLVRRGAKINNITAAAALGRLDLVKNFFNEDGSLKAGIAGAHFPGVVEGPKIQMEKAFIWACQYGRTNVVDFLLEKGVDPAAGANTAQTGFHLAADAGHLDTVKLLIKRNAPLELRNVHGGTVLGQALWSIVNEPQPNHVQIVEALLDAGAHIEEGSLGWLEKQDIAAASKVRIAESLRRHGAKS